MKNKKVTYFLLVLAIVVWGCIIWKITLPGKKPPAAPVPVRQTTEVKRDSFELMLNYRDPFLDRQTATSAEKKNGPGPIYADQYDGKVPDFIYKGTIAARKKTYAVICRDNEEILLSRGDRVDEFSIVKYDGEELVATRKGKTFKLPIE